MRSRKGSQINIYIKVNEGFGIYSYSMSLSEYLKSKGYLVSVVRCGFFGALFGAFDDSIKKNVSIYSLSYGPLCILNRNSSIFLLHGFPGLKDYKVYKFLLISISYVVCGFFCKHILANSRITKDICQKIYSLKVNSYWNPLLAISDVTQFSVQKSFENLLKRKRIIIVGRIVSAKRVYEAIQAFKSIPEFSSWELIVAGPVLDKRVLEVANNVGNIKLLGLVTRERVDELLQESTALISFNELEPYGLVLEEAARASIGIITTPYSGAVYELNRIGYPYLWTCDPAIPFSICSVLEKNLINLNK